MGFLLRLFINALALWLTVLLGQNIGLKMGIDSNGDINRAVATVVLMVVLLAVVNAVIKPILRLVMAPLNCLTLGLLSFATNALMFLLAGAIVNSLGFGFRVGGFWGGLFGSIVMGLISAVASQLVADDKNDKGRRD